MMRAFPLSRKLTPAFLPLLLSMLLTAASGQALSSRSFDTPVTTQDGPAVRDRSGGQPDGWVKVAPAGEEFTVQMPGRPSWHAERVSNGSDRTVNFYGTITESDMYMISSSPKASGDGASMDAMLNPLAGEYEHPLFKQMREQGGQVSVSGQRDLALGGYRGREYRLVLAREIPCVARVYVTRRRVYTLVWIYNRVASLSRQPKQEKFLESFTLGPINTDAAASNVRAGDENAERAGNGTGIGSGSGIGVGPGCGGVGCDGGGGNTGGRVSADDDNDARRVLRPNEVTRKARILSKPEAEYTAEARKNNVSGTVVLRVVLAADGSVKNIVAVRGLPDGLTEKAIMAARRLKFAPASKDGRPVSQYVVLEYNFNPY